MPGKTKDILEKFIKPESNIQKQAPGIKDDILKTHWNRVKRSFTKQQVQRRTYTKNVNLKGMNISDNLLRIGWNIFIEIQGYKNTLLENFIK